MTLRYDFANLKDINVRVMIDHWLAQNPAATIFHTTDWNMIVQDVFQTEFRYSLAFEKNELVGLMPCHLVKSGPWLTTCFSPPRLYEVSYGGPVAIGPQQTPTCAGLVLTAARMRCGVIVDIFNSPQNTEWASQVGWKKVTPFESAYVDLDQSLENIWTLSLNGKRRNMIRKAEKQGVVVQDTGLSGLDDLYALIEKTARRANLQLKPKLYYQRILETFGPQNQARLILAYLKDRPLAGAIILRFRDMAYYWIGATETDAENLGQGELLQWTIIQGAKQIGCRWYDLVGVERERLPHIAVFKLGFTRHFVEFHHVSRYTLFSRIIRRAQNLLYH